ncbi:hypothetical protein V492_08031 [Pseudogymnoascus sp. VKM F-4246]|nr:hypothetical protein V492_08031 [Pseudogymnoascus sp. VKM F-4246]
MPRNTPRNRRDKRRHACTFATKETRKETAKESQKPATICEEEEGWGKNAIPITREKREAYCGYTAAPGGSCAARARAAPPCASWPGAPARPRWRHAPVGDAASRRRTAGSTPRRSARRR